MNREEEEKLESIKQELISINALITYLREQYITTPLFLYSEENLKISKEIEPLEKKRKRLVYEKKYFRKHNRFPKQRKPKTDKIRPLH